MGAEALKEYPTIMTSSGGSDLKFEERGSDRVGGVRIWLEPDESVTVEVIEPSTGRWVTLNS